MEPRGYHFSVTIACVTVDLIDRARSLRSNAKQRVSLEYSTSATRHFHGKGGCGDGHDRSLPGDTWNHPCPLRPFLGPSRTRPSSGSRSKIFPSLGRDLRSLARRSRFHAEAARHLRQHATGAYMLKQCSGCSLALYSGVLDVYQRRNCLPRPCRALWG